VVRLSLPKERRINRSRRDGVNRDTTTAQVLCEDTGNLLDSSFGGEVAEGVGEDGWYEMLSDRNADPHST